MSMEYVFIVLTPAARASDMKCFSNQRYSLSFSPGILRSNVSMSFTPRLLKKQVMMRQNNTGDSMEDCKEVPAWPDLPLVTKEY